MRKIFVLAMIGCLLLAGCGSKSEKEQSETEVTIQEDANVSGEVAEVTTPTPDVEENQEASENTTASTETPESTPEATETPVTTETPAATEYTYFEYVRTMYAKSSVNLRDLPNTEGKQVGKLATNEEVSVILQCNETGWYGIEYNGSVAYVSNNYLVGEPVQVASNTPNPGDENNGGNDGGNTTPTPAPTPAPVDDTPAAPSSGNGSDIAFTGGTVTLDNGKTIKTLNKFNYAGISNYDGINNGTWSINGDYHDSSVQEAYNVWLNNMEVVDYVGEGPNGFGECSNPEEFGYFSIRGGSSSWDIAIQPQNGYYKLTIKVPLDIDVAHQILDGNAWDNETQINKWRDATTVLLSMVTSKPLDVRNAILNGMYGSPSSISVDEFNTWYSVGDCKIYFSEDETYFPNSIATIYIKPN